MFPYERRFDWMPKKISAKLERKLAPFSPLVRGWAIFYRGKTRTVCGKTVLLEDVPGRWEEKRAEIDAELKLGRPAKRTPSTVTLIEAISDFFEFIDKRVETGKPEPMAPITASDYRRALDRLARTQPTKGGNAGLQIGSLPIADLGPDDFGAFAKQYENKSAFTFSRITAYVHAFFNFCVEDDLIEVLPKFGRNLARPSQQARRDRRMDQKKSYKPAELAALMAHATVEERAWIGLGLSGAMDNADVGYLTFNLLNRAEGTIDYRRRKRGKVLRIIPVHGIAWEWLDAYLQARPKPARGDLADRIFLTPTGLELQRLVPGKSGAGNSIDYVAMQWGRLAERAGLRPARKVESACVVCGKPRKVVKRGRVPFCVHCGAERPGRKRTVVWGGGADGRGFRSLRTTFPNLAPAGYRDEIELVMGHSNGGILVDHYLEEHGLERLEELVRRIWEKATSTELKPPV